jgi:hypothetical protein
MQGMKTGLDALPVQPKRNAFKGSGYIPTYHKCLRQLEDWMLPNDFGKSLA